LIRCRLAPRRREIVSSKWAGRDAGARARAACRMKIVQRPSRILNGAPKLERILVYNKSACFLHPFRLRKG